jgi:hypothetical protein
MNFNMWISGACTMAGFMSMIEGNLLGTFVGLGFGALNFWIAYINKKHTP